MSPDIWTPRKSQGNNLAIKQSLTIASDHVIGLEYMNTRPESFSISECDSEIKKDKLGYNPLVTALEPVLSSANFCLNVPLRFSLSLRWNQFSSCTYTVLDAPEKSCQQANQVKYGHSDLLDLVTASAGADLTCLT